MGMAKWREISGISAENEMGMGEEERRSGLRKLYRMAEAEMRSELKRAAEDLEHKSERTFLWEPIAAVCRRLEISQANLTRLLKELTGMSATQLADRIRAEGLREKLRARLAAWFKEGGKPGEYFLNEKYSLEQHVSQNWKELKASRREMSFSYAEMAVELGFANYGRLYRACMLQYGKTPSQLEDEIVREFTRFYILTGELEERWEAAQAENQNDPKFEKYRAPFTDEWAEAVREKPEWIGKMKAELGLSEEMVKWEAGVVE